MADGAVTLALLPVLDDHVVVFIRALLWEEFCESHRKLAGLRTPLLLLLSS